MILWTQIGFKLVQGRIEICSICIRFLKIPCMKDFSRFRRMDASKVKKLYNLKYNNNQFGGKR